LRGGKVRHIAQKADWIPQVKGSFPIQSPEGEGLIDRRGEAASSSRRGRRAALVSSARRGRVLHFMSGGKKKKTLSLNLRGGGEGEREILPRKGSLFSQKDPSLKGAASYLLEKEDAPSFGCAACRREGTLSQLGEKATLSDVLSQQGERERRPLFIWPMSSHLYQLEEKGGLREGRRCFSLKRKRGHFHHQLRGDVISSTRKGSKA